MQIIKDVIVMNANAAELMKSKLIPALSSNPIPLIGIPNLKKII